MRQVRTFRQYKDGKFYYWGITNEGYVKMPEVETKYHDELSNFPEVKGEKVYERDICKFTLKNQFGSLYVAHGIVRRGEKGEFGFVNDISPPFLISESVIESIEKVGDVYSNVNLLKECLKKPEEWENLR